MSKKFLLSLATLVLIVGASCSTKKSMTKSDVTDEVASTESNTGFDESSISGQEWKELPFLANVQFDYDKASLSQEARDILVENYKWLREYPQVEVLIAGHCDERGTVEYNIALGQKRADIVKTYYASLGLAKDKIKTTSFGEERPMCEEKTDECWMKNRRSETKVRIPNEQSARLNQE